MPKNKNDDFTSFADILKKGRHQLGISQKELAKEIGRSTVTVGRWENNSDKAPIPNAQDTRKIAALFGEPHSNLRKAKKEIERELQAAGKSLTGRRGSRPASPTSQREGGLGPLLREARENVRLRQIDVVKKLEQRNRQLPEDQQLPVPTQRVVSFWEVNRELPSEDQLQRLLRIFRPKAKLTASIWGAFWATNNISVTRAARLSRKTKPRDPGGVS